MLLCSRHTAEFVALEEMAATIAKRTHTRFIADAEKQASFVAFIATVEAFSCEDSLGMWGHPKTIDQDDSGIVRSPTQS